MGSLSRFVKMAENLVNCTQYQTKELNSKICSRAWMSEWVSMSEFDRRILRIRPIKYLLKKDFIKKMDQWNNDIFSIKYSYKKNLLIFKGIVFCNDTDYNLINHHTSHISSVQCPVFNKRLFGHVQKVTYSLVYFN